MTTYARASNVDSASVIQVIQVFSVTGAGVVGDPVRQIVEYYSLDGDLLAWRDPCKVAVLTQRTAWPGEVAK